MEIREEIEDLTSKLKVYQDTYYKRGESLVSDQEYDRLFDKLKKLEEEWPEYALVDSPTRRVGSDLTNDFPEVTHTIPVLSLDKAYSREEVLSFFSKSIAKEGGVLSFAAEQKIDGISMVLYYEDGILQRAVTRGNGEVGNDVTPNIVTIPTVPLKLNERVDLAVRGEVYLPKADFLRLNALEEDESKKAANPRNLAAGTVRRLKSSEAAQVPLNMFCYEGFWNNREDTPKDHLHILAKLKALGFRINPDFAFFAPTKVEAEEKLKEAGLEGDAYSFDELQSYIDKESKERRELAYEIDGLVFKINELDVREHFGYTEHHPRWAIAYKFESPQAVSVLTGITCQVGRTGRITPVAEVTATKLGGSIVKRATLHNQEYIDELELAIGDTISITKRGDVIPAVEEVLEKNTLGNTTYELPKECPCCHTTLIKEGAHQFCPNFYCSDQVKGRIAFFSSRDMMDIETLGPKTVEILYDKGLITKIEDIYSADYDSLIGTPGIGEKTIELLKKGVKESLDKPYKVVLASLGIAELGPKMADILISNGFDNIDKLISAAKGEDSSVFTSIKGVGESTATTIKEAFKSEDLLNTIVALKKAGLHFNVTQDVSDDVEYPQVFKDQVWCVTGSFDNFNPRSKAMAEVEKRGGRTVSSVTGKTTHLLVGKGGGSKRAEAERLGIKIVSETEFLSLLGISSTFNGEPEQGMLF